MIDGEMAAINLNMKTSTWLLYHGSIAAASPIKLHTETSVCVGHRLDVAMFLICDVHCIRSAAILALQHMYSSQRGFAARVAESATEV